MEKKFKLKKEGEISYIYHLEKPRYRCKYLKKSHFGLISSPEILDNTLVTDADLTRFLFAADNWAEDNGLK